MSAKRATSGNSFYDAVVRHTEPYMALKSITSDLLKEVISDRDSLHDSCTNARGEYNPGEDGREDRLEIERLDALIDRARAALGEEQ